MSRSGDDMEGPELEAGQDTDSDNGPPSLCASTSSSDDDYADDVDEMAVEAESLLGDQGNAHAGPQDTNQRSSVPGGNSNGGAHTPQPGQAQPGAPFWENFLFDPSAFNMDPSVQSMDPGPPVPMMPQRRFVISGGTTGPVFTGFGPIPDPDRMNFFDMFSSAMMAGEEQRMFGGDPFLQALQASLNMEQREKPKASPAALDTVLSVKLCEGDSVECPISAETLGEGGWVARMPCGHYFGHQELQRWLNQNNTCPVCRFEIPTVDGEYNQAKGLSLARVEQASRESMRAHSDLLAQRMQQAHEHVLEDILAASLDDVHPAVRSLEASEDTVMGESEAGENALLRELHQQRAARRREKEESDNAIIDAAMLECLLAKQRQRFFALSQDGAVDAGLLPFAEAA